MLTHDAATDQGEGILLELWTPLSAHAEWITLFRETLYGGAALGLRKIVDAEACEVGQWLNQHHNSIGHLPEYGTAKDIHEKFHRRATDCIRLANAGRRLDALADTDEGGELRRLSRLLVKVSQDLKVKAREQRLPVK